MPNRDKSSFIYNEINIWYRNNLDYFFAHKHTRTGIKRETKKYQNRDIKFSQTVACLSHVDSSQDVELESNFNKQINIREVKIHC